MLVGMKFRPPWICIDAGGTHPQDRGGTGGGQEDPLIVDAESVAIMLRLAGFR
jgi:hypothetical protein